MLGRDTCRYANTEAKVRAGVSVHLTSMNQRKLWVESGALRLWGGQHFPSEWKERGLGE
jgi:hypothetical protein